MPQPRRLHDRYFRQAKAEGYLARSAYKLAEIDDRKKLLRPGDRVLDLGCAPGSWLQVAAERVGPAGVVVGLDLKESAAGLGARVLALQGDVFETDPADLARAAASVAGGEPRAFDVILSDMAPNTSGHGDDLVSARLCRRVLEIVPELLRPGGHLVVKIFEGAEYPGVLGEAGAMFGEARGFKPKASREVSREMYIVAKGLRAAR
ncbi:MAG: RlmE family RNA methyltransferase [Phycisphaerae bacterium]|nr:RlmE family RNA methyltransferase [Phycisphaerae bacterium]